MSTTKKSLPDHVRESLATVGLTEDDVITYTPEDYDALLRTTPPVRRGQKLMESLGLTEDDVKAHAPDSAAAPRAPATLVQERAAKLDQLLDECGLTAEDLNAAKAAGMV